MENFGRVEARDLWRTPEHRRGELHVGTDRFRRRSKVGHTRSLLLQANNRDVLGIDAPPLFMLLLTSLTRFSNGPLHSQLGALPTHLRR